MPLVFKTIYGAFLDVLQAYYNIDSIYNKKCAYCGTGQKSSISRNISQIKSYPNFE